MVKNRNRSNCIVVFFCAFLVCVSLNAKDSQRERPAEVDSFIYRRIVLEVTIQQFLKFNLDNRPKAVMVDMSGDDSFMLIKDLNDKLSGKGITFYMTDFSRLFPDATETEVNAVKAKVLSDCYIFESPFILVRDDEFVFESSIRHSSNEFAQVRLKGLVTSIVSEGFYKLEHIQVFDLDDQDYFIWED